jgi:hypothetical protein
MARVAFRAEPEDVEWFVVSPPRPCPVCRATSGCSIRADGEFACCMRTVCEWPVVTGGWLHRLEQSGAAEVLNVP